MSLFYRSIVSWTAAPTSGGPVTEPNTPWQEYSRRQYEVFLNAFYGNAIWLGSGTYDLLQGFADAGKDILNEFRHMNSGGRLPDGSRAWDRRAERLTPHYNAVEDAPKAEIEASRYIIPYRIVIKRNTPDQEDRG